MADVYWVGGDSGNENDMTVAANWWDVQAGAAQVPVANDVVWFDGRAGDDASTGKKYSAEASGTAALLLDGVHVMSDYDGDIGTVLEPWEFHLTVTTDLWEQTEEFTYAGAGTAYIMCRENASADCCIPLTVCKAATGGALHLISELNTGTSYSLLAKVICISGTLHLWGTAAAAALAVGAAGDACCVAELEMVGGTCYSQEGVSLIATLGADYSGAGNNFDNAVANQATYIIMKGGTLYWNSRLVDDITSSPLEHILNIFGGIFNWGQDTYSGETAQDAGWIKLWGGTFNWGIEDAAISIIGKISVYTGGTFQISTTQGVGGVKNLGIANTRSEVFTGGTVDLTSAYGQFEFPNATDVLVNRGGTIVIPEKEEVTWQT